MTRSFVIVILAVGLSLGAVGGILAPWHWQMMPGAMHMMWSGTSGSVTRSTRSIRGTTAR